MKLKITYLLIFLIILQFSCAIKSNTLSELPAEYFHQEKPPILEQNNNKFIGVDTVTLATSSFDFLDIISHAKMGFISNETVH